MPETMRDLVGLRSGADLEVVMCGRQLELAEEHAVHLEAVVLAGVEQHVGHAARDAGAHHRRHLDDLGTRAHHDRDLHEEKTLGFRGGGAAGRPGGCGLSRLRDSAVFGRGHSSLHPAAIRALKPTGAGEEQANGGALGRREWNRPVGVSSFGSEERISIPEVSP
jgi:hypothetical protein